MSRVGSGNGGNDGSRATKDRAGDRAEWSADTVASGVGHEAVDGETITASTDRTLPGAALHPAGCPELPLRAPERYQRGIEIARGGMGRISALRDEELGRNLAIKELMSKDPAAAARFEREVRITSRLQHPAIIAILEAGRWPDGKPFYTMRRVEGRSLDKVIASKSSLADRLACLPTVIAVADALAYAHSQRILHRDLKPANVLVGEFGETVVIDWGLGKDLSDPTMDDEPIGAEEPSGATITMFGEAVGTPAYMPPEQAHGKPVDERADVYALGAVLYHLLAGRPPYADTRLTSTEAILEKVITTAPTPLGELEPGAPADLLALVGKAMARDPDARYPTANELAADLTRYATGQLVTAHTYSTRTLIRRWVRRHRAIVAMAAVMLLVLIAGGVAGFWRIARERDRAERLKRSAEVRSTELEELMDFMLGDLRVKLEPIGRLDLLAMVADRAADYYTQRPVDRGSLEAARKRAVALVNLGDVLADQGDLDGALAQYSNALEIREGLALLAPEDAARQADLAVSHSRVGTTLRTRGNVDGAISHHQAALARAERATEQEPANPVWQRGLSISHERLGSALYARGDLAGALEHHRAALAITSRLATEAPDSLTGQRDLAFDHQNVGGVLSAQGDPAGALEHYRIALAILERLAEQNGGDASCLRELLVGHEKVGGALRAQGRLAEALVHDRAALALGERLVARDPSNATWQRDLAYSHTNISGLLRSQGDLDHALEHARAGMTIAETLAARDRTNIEWQNDAAVSYAFVGATLRARGDDREATQLYRKCAEAYQAYATIANDFYNAGCCFALNGDADRAFAMLEQAVARGFRNAPALEGDPDLESLHTDPRWPPLLAAVSAE